MFKPDRILGATPPDEPVGVTGLPNPLLGGLTAGQVETIGELVVRSDRPKSITPHAIESQEAVGLPHLAGGATMTYDDLVAATIGVAGYWPLGETTGTTARDLVAGHDGTYVGGVTLAQAGAGTASNAAAFDGASGGVDIPDAPALNPVNASGDPMTLECWTKCPAADNPTGDGLAIVTKYDGNTSFGYYLVLRASLGLENFAVWGVDNGTFEQFTDLLLDGGWHHLVLIADPASATLARYVDGTLVQTIGFPTHTGSAAVTTPLRFAHRGTVESLFGDDPAFTKITMQRVALYKAALPAGTIANHYAQGIA